MATRSGSPRSPIHLGLTASTTAAPRLPFRRLRVHKAAGPPVWRPGRCAQTAVMVTDLLLAGRCRTVLPMWMK